MTEEKKTRIIRVNADEPELEILEEAARVLREGGLVAFPTETVYGLGALAESERAVAKIFAAKNRPATNPLIVHVATLEEAKTLAGHWPQAAEDLARAFWPGPLTLVVKKSDRIPAAACAGLDTVAIRMPAHPVALALIELVGAPLAAPSANPYTRVSPTTAEHVMRGLGGRIDMIIDAGPTSSGVESALVSVVENPAEILRPGMIDRKRLSGIVELASIKEIVVEDSRPRPSPGLSRNHYSPRPRVRLVEREEFLDLLDRGEGREFIGVGEDDEGKVYHLPPDPSGYARGLYKAFHHFDRSDVEEIIVEKPGDDSGAWTAIYDRLRRASSKSR